MGVPYTFGTATTSIPLSNLDANFNTPVTIGNATVGLGNTVTTVGNLTLTNATISSGNVTVTTGIFGAGSNTAPSITTAGDTNTGIFFPAADTIAFSEGGVESMRFDSSGNLLVGTTTATGKIVSNQSDASSRCFAAISPASFESTAYRSSATASASTSWYHMYGSSSSDTVNNIFIYGNGNIQNANNSYGAISDIKLKENIVDATPKLEKLMQVKVRNYNLKGEYEQHKQIGVIAQELETIFPSLIEETQDRGANDELLETTTKSVKYSVFVPMLIKAVQELKTELDSVKAELQTLKGN